MCPRLSWKVLALAGFFAIALVSLQQVPGRISGVAGKERRWSQHVLGRYV